MNLNRDRVRPFLNRNPGRKWFDIKNATAPDVAEIYIYDEIGMWGTCATDFIQALQGVTAPKIDLRVHSPGGDVFEAFAIYNALKRHPANITSHVDGLAASAATYPVLAADEVRMSKSAFFMIHDPWTLAVGDANDLRKSADTLDQIRVNIAQMYADATGADLATIEQQMADETWFDADAAKAAGFVDVVTDGSDPVAENKWDLSIFNKIPDALRTSRANARNATREVKTVRELEDLLRDEAGLPHSKAKAIASQFCPKSEPRDEDGAGLLSVVPLIAANIRSLSPKR